MCDHADHASSCENNDFNNLGYHGVHGEVVVLSLQLHGVLVTSANLCVTLQEHFLVVADPVKHLHTHRHTQQH